MKKIALLCLIIIAAVSNMAHAQQDARYTMYTFNKLPYNPAYAGSKDGLSALLIARTQWVGIEGAPKGGAFSLHTALGSGQKIGLGGHLEYDQIGVHQRVSAFVDYAYRFNMGESRLALGIQGGGLYQQSDWSKIDGNEYIDPTDDLAFNNGQSESIFLPNFGLGIYYSRPGKFFLGASVPHLLNNKLRKDSPGIEKIAAQYNHYYLAGGVMFPLGNAIKLQPSVLVKATPSNAPIQLDGTLLFLIKDVLWLGGSYRTAIGYKQDQTTYSSFEGESIDAMAIFQLKNGWRIGYAYDYTLSELNKFTKQSHEIMVGYDIPKRQDRIITPRYFSTNEYF